MGVRIQELPETTGIKKEDVLIVEDGQGTKKGTVQQLDEALGVSQLKEDLVDLQTKTRINYLRPTLQTTTQNGVTCTNNGDGTYTLNGTATSITTFWIGECKLKYGKYKILGTPNVNGCSMGGSIHGEIHYDGIILEQEINGAVAILVDSGITVNNAVFKPMITDDLSATYDDFVSGFDCLTRDLKMDLLWTNASPTSEFVSQLIQLNTAYYKLLAITFRNYAHFGENNTMIMPNDYDCQYYAMTVNTGVRNDIHSRAVLSGSKGVFFYDGYYNNNVDNRAIIPIRIYGLK